MQTFFFSLFTVFLISVTTMAEEPSNTPEGSNPGTTGSGCTECLTANFPGGIRSANDMDEAKARADRYVDLLGGNKDGKPPKSETTDQAH